MQTGRFLNRVFGMGMYALLGWSLSFSSVFASEAVDEPKPGPHAYRDARSEVCEFGCLYDKANENIGLQIKYILAKLVALRDSTPMGRKAALSEFCSEGEDSEGCFNRYIRLQVYVLRKMHAAMVKNYESSTLVSNQMKNHEPIYPHVLGVKSEDESKKSKQMPYVVTYEDLKKDFADLASLGSNQYQSWAEQLPAEPSPDDFVEFEEKLKDPSDPSAGHFMVVLHDDDGKIKYNKKAYEAALKRYHERIEGEFRRMGKEKSRKRKSPRNLDESVGDLHRAAFSQAKKFEVETWVPKNGKPTIQSQAQVVYGKPSGVQPSPQSQMKREVKEMTIDELKKQGVTSLYQSPQAVGQIIEELEKSLLKFGQ